MADDNVLTKTYFEIAGYTLTGAVLAWWMGFGILPLLVTLFALFLMRAGFDALDAG
jgi:hypothetical protein